jgi:hypothetical protein
MHVESLQTLLSVFIGVHQWLIPFHADGISYTLRSRRTLRLSEMRGFEFLPKNYFEACAMWAVCCLLSAL